MKLKKKEHRHVLTFQTRERFYYIGNIIHEKIVSPIPNKSNIEGYNQKNKSFTQKDLK
jgi:hypothetical protein